jgi:hypothetical protein
MRGAGRLCGGCGRAKTPGIGHAPGESRLFAPVHSAAIEHIEAVAEQVPQLDHWRRLQARFCQRIVGQIGLPVPPPTLAAPG